MIRALWGLLDRKRLHVPSAGKDEEQVAEGIQLDMLPTEIIMEIMEQADLPTFICLSQASGRYREISQRSTFHNHHRRGAAVLTKFLTMRPPNRHVSNYPYSEVPALLRWPEERSALRESLRKTLFCQDCLQHKRTESEFFDKNVLFRRRRCRACSLAAGNSVSHPLWQFRLDEAWIPGQCLAKTGYVQFCRHISWTQSTFKESRRRNLGFAARRVLTCEICNASISWWDSTTGSFVITWKINTSEMLPSYSSPHELEHDYRPISDLMAQQGVASAIYTCPHHDLSNGRLESIIAGLWGKEHRHVLGPPPRTGDHTKLVRLRVSERLGCRYCSTTIQMLVIYEAQIEHPGTPQAALKYQKIVDIEFRVQRILDTADSSTWISNLELGSLGPLTTHHSLKHLTWCDDARCATNKRAKICPVLLQEHNGWLINSVSHRCRLIKKKWTQRYYAAGFPLSDTLADDTNPQSLLGGTPCCIC